MPSRTLIQLRSICDAIRTEGDQNLTRLTVAKKWFSSEQRIRDFSVGVGLLVYRRCMRSKGAKKQLLDRAGMILDEIRAGSRKNATDRLQALHRDLFAFQDKFVRQRWNLVRTIIDRDLCILEEAIELQLPGFSEPNRAYHLVRSFCENYDAKFGNSLNGPSVDRIEEICGLISEIEEN